MREIKFRGKRVDNNEWVEGDLIQLDSRIMIADKGMAAYDKGNAHEHISIECVEVIPETVGQYTGMKDKNGVEIYECDIVKIIAKPYDTNPCIVKWVFKSHSWSLKCEIINSKYVRIKYYSLPPSKNIEVIGNIHDNDQMHK